jgi:glyoxylase-like metal-dependent hydrolase (beta-lactamase superfamily II)
MRVIRLTGDGATYSANAHLLLGDWNAIGDVNTLVDTGRDPRVLELLRQAATGVGKRAVEQVILTHSHYDHVGLLEEIRAEYGPKVCAFGTAAGAVDVELRDGDRVRAGDGVLEVIHAPGHSSDSICLYCEKDGLLFAGDAPLLVHSADNTYEESFGVALDRICQRDVRAIHFGHGAPVLEGCNERLRRSRQLLGRGQRPRAGAAESVEEGTP